MTGRNRVGKGGQQSNRFGKCLHLLKRASCSLNNVYQQTVHLSESVLFLVGAYSRGIPQILEWKRDALIYYRVSVS